MPELEYAMDVKNEASFLEHGFQISCKDYQQDAFILPFDFVQVFLGSMVGWPEFFLKFSLTDDVSHAYPRQFDLQATKNIA